MANEHDYEKDFERELFEDIHVIYDAGYRHIEFEENSGECLSIGEQK
jgi:hypothetical protein